MWVTGDGEFCTAALPDATTAMSARFERSLAALSIADHTELIYTLMERQEAFCEEFEAMGVTVPSEPTTPDEDALPDAYLDADFVSTGELLGYLDQLDPRWRLDAFNAVEDFAWHHASRPVGFRAGLRRLFSRNER